MRYRWIRAIVVPGLLLTLAAGCGSSDSSEDVAKSDGGSSSSSSDSSPSAATSPSAAASPQAGGDEICAQLTKDGGPGDAFTVIPLYSVDQAKKAAAAQQALMQGLTPPSQVAADWKQWKAVLDKAVALTSKPGGSLQPLAGPQDKAEQARKRLEDYAFSTCG